MNYNCANVSDLRNLQGQVEKAFCLNKLFKIFANSPPSASNFKKISRSIENNFLTEQFWKQNTNYFFTFSETTYKKFVGTVQVQAQNLPKEIDVSFKSKCADDFVSETSVCKNIPYGESVDFTASITLDRCVNKSLQFEISPIGIGQVRFLVKKSEKIL